MRSLIAILFFVVLAGTIRAEIEPDLLSKVARAGHAWAQYNLGTKYDNGNGCPKRSHGRREVVLACC